MIKIGVLCYVEEASSGSLAGHRGVQDIWEAINIATKLTPTLINRLCDIHPRANRMLFELDIPDGINPTDLQTQLINSKPLAGVFRRLDGITGPVIVQMFV